MTEMEALLLVADLVAVFPQITEEATGLYVARLLPFDAEVGRRAVDVLIDRETFLTPGKVKTQCHIEQDRADDTRYYVASSEEQRQGAREVMARVMADYRATHPDSGPSVIFDDPDPDPVETFRRVTRPVVAMQETDPCTNKLLELRHGHLMCADGHCHDADCTPVPRKSGGGCKRNGEAMRKRWTEIERAGGRDPDKVKL